MDEERLARELREVRVELEGVTAMMRMLLKHRLIQDGHAKDFREASRIIEDKARLEAIYPASGED